ncbi:hypothetical protein KUCAC02_004170 [Chaenocephalus aceratus]|uniref:Uncharacterized protein n=1 Tax=Chaenocephalus aceratus TaxID=36190 RepID=A0ACB9WZJ7_CHAAC|nr:hypothetical protein KUCAC02_004170 [Chaenocephalus aceratus]
MGGIPRLFMAVAQALGSDMGIVIDPLESIVMLQIPSAERRGQEGRVIDLFLSDRPVNCPDCRLSQAALISPDAKANTTVNNEKRCTLHTLHTSEGLWQSPLWRQRSALCITVCVCLHNIFSTGIPGVQTQLAECYNVVCLSASLSELLILELHAVTAVERPDKRACVFVVVIMLLMRTSRAGKLLQPY